MKTADFILLALLGVVTYLIWKSAAGGRTEAPMIQVQQKSSMDFGSKGGGTSSMPFANFFS